MSITDTDLDVAVPRIQHLQSYLDAMPMACVLVSPTDTISVINAALGHMLDGHPPQIGESIFQLVASTQRERLAHTLEGTRRGEPRMSADLHVRSETREDFIEVRALASSWSLDGVPPGTCLLLLNDLTQLRREERERRRLQRDMNVAQIRGAIALLLGNMTQNIHVVLGNINRVASLALLTDSHRSHEASGPDMREITYACDEARTMLASMASHTWQGRNERREVNLNDLVPGVVKLVRHISTPLVHIEVTVGPGQLCAVIGVAQVFLALTNLCSNAVESFGVGGNEPLRMAELSEQAPPLLSVLVIAEHVDAERAFKLEIERGEYVKIAVTDNGQGMAPEVKERASELFFSLKPPDAGVGLGLALVAACAQSHRGAVEIESEPGRGTTVSLLLPRHFPRGETNAPSPQTAAVAALRRSLSPLSSVTDVVQESKDPDGRRALFVDDEPLMQMTGRRILEKLDFHVDVAKDGLEAFEIYFQNPDRYTLIVLDVSLPRMSGIEVLERILERSPRMNVLLITGHSTLPVPPAVFAKPNVYLLQKPFSIDEMRAAINRLLHAK